MNAWLREWRNRNVYGLHLEDDLTYHFRSKTLICFLALLRSLRVRDVLATVYSGLYTVLKLLLGGSSLIVGVGYGLALIVFALFIAYAFIRLGFMSY